MITIHQPKIIDVNGRSRVDAILDIDGKQCNLWFEVDKEYEKYLCYERADAFLVGALPWAMRNKHDITCVAPVTTELFFNLNHYLLPTLYKFGKTLHPTKIIAATSSEQLENYGGVGTGMSCGVDSFHAVLKHWRTEDERPNLTHLCINNTGSFNNFGNYALYGADKAREEVYSRAASVAKELGLPLISTDSNIINVFPIFVQAHTYTSSFAILCMQKLWKTYFFASTLDFSYFSLKNHEIKDPCLYDLLLFNCVSTRGLRIYSEGSSVNRLEKTAFIADNSVAQKHLHACYTKGYNCGTCAKCRRTLLTLDVLDKLDDFKESFNVDYYRDNIDEYLTFLAKVYIEEKLDGNYPEKMTLGGNYYERYPQCEPIYPYILQGKHADRYNAILADLEERLPPSCSKEIIIKVLDKGEISLPPSIHARGAIVVDAHTDKTFYEKDADIRMIAPCAAKIMTCIIALEYGSLHKKINMMNNGTPLDEQMTIHDLLYGMMLNGYSNCADALAIAISGSVPTFVVEMNNFARDFDMQNSRFMSASGILGDSCSARDVACLTRHAFQNPLFQEIIAAPMYSCASSIRSYKFENANALIHQNADRADKKYSLCIGGKVATLGKEASFVSIARAAHESNPFILVQLGITDEKNFSNVIDHSFIDAVKIHEWVFDSFFEDNKNRKSKRPKGTGE